MPVSDGDLSWSDSASQYDQRSARKRESPRSAVSNDGRAAGCSAMIQLMVRRLPATIWHLRQVDFMSILWSRNLRVNERLREDLLRAAKNAVNLLTVWSHMQTLSRSFCPWRTGQSTYIVLAPPTHWLFRLTTLAILYSKNVSI
ncbi:hypothetical protein C8R45DRAFT_935848 [Mycena sanguinolenta]|nr:hypothetical protein C8R45DRAFT_935848 [Mycena sanguinolenta]